MTSLQREQENKTKPIKVRSSVPGSAFRPFPCLSCWPCSGRSRTVRNCESKRLMKHQSTHTKKEIFSVPVVVPQCEHLILQADEVDVLVVKLVNLKRRIIISEVLKTNAVDAI